MRVNVFVVTYQLFSVFLYAVSALLTKMIEMNDCVVEREMQEGRAASRFIRGAII